MDLTFLKYRKQNPKCSLKKKKQKQILVRGKGPTISNAGQIILLRINFRDTLVLINDYFEWRLRIFRTRLEVFNFQGPNVFLCLFKYFFFRTLPGESLVQWARPLLVKNVKKTKVSN